MYKIAIGKTISELEEKVSNLLKSGFKPSGGITVIPHYDLEKDTENSDLAEICRKSSAPTTLTVYAQSLSK